MRRLVVTATLLGFCAVAQAHEPVARPVERSPSIMVDDEADKPPAVKRRKTTRPRASRAGRTAPTRARRLVVPRLSPIYEGQTRTINGSIGRQLQESQSEQNRQVDINLLRQEIQRGIDSPPLGCTPGSLRC